MTTTAVTDSERGSGGFVLDVNNVTKTYGRFRRKFTVLSDLSLQVERGKHLLILGPNGAGKTTLLKCILGLASFSGRIRVNGLDAKSKSTDVKKTIGYMPQNYAFYENLTVIQQAKMSQKLKHCKDEETTQMLQTVDLWNVRNRKVRALSDGMRQRLGIALAMLGDPPFLILDEPTSNIDLRGQLEFQDILLRLREEGKTMVTTTHLTGLGELATEVLVLDRGRRIALGSPDELLGRFNVSDTLYLRVNDANRADLVKFVNARLRADVTSKGRWLTVPISNAVKLEALKDLLVSGIKIEDLMLERTSIESEYLKLLDRGAAR